jgi:hypothetical protein
VPPMPRRSNCEVANRGATPPIPMPALIRPTALARPLANQTRQNACGPSRPTTQIEHALPGFQAHEPQGGFRDGQMVLLHFLAAALLGPAVEFLLQNLVRSHEKEWPVASLQLWFSVLAIRYLLFGTSLLCYILPRDAGNPIARAAAALLPEVRTGGHRPADLRRLFGRDLPRLWHTARIARRAGDRVTTCFWRLATDSCLCDFW